MIDELTHVMNRRGILEALEQELAHAHDFDRELSVLLVDVDGFKEINDQQGHLVGDAVLEHIAGHLSDRVRRSDHVGRYGGDEFLVVLPGADVRSAEALATDLAVCSCPYFEAPIHFSIGVAGREPGDDPTVLVHRADVAMYRQKRHCRRHSRTATVIPTKYPVRKFMSPCPHSIRIDTFLEEARSLMRQIGVRHLPVLHEGALVGVLSDHDISVAEAFPKVDLTKTHAGAAMSTDFYVAGPEMPLGLITRAMAEGKTSCSVIVDAGAVVGIFTTTDVLAVLSDSLLAPGGEFTRALMAPSRVRKRILAQHRSLRKTIRELTDLATRVVEAEDPEATRQLPAKSREIFEELLRHMTLEDEILAPALRDIDAFGDVRADELLDDHRAQRAQFRELIQQINEQPDGSHELARTVLGLLPQLLVDMQREEQELLTDRLLCDDIIQSDVFTG